MLVLKNYVMINKTNRFFSKVHLFTSERDRHLKINKGTGSKIPSSPSMVFGEGPGGSFSLTKPQKGDL